MPLVIGALLIAVPADFASRLKSLIVSLVSYGLGTLALGFCTGFSCLASFSAFRAFWSSALLCVTTVYVAELQIPRHRGRVLVFLQVFWLLGVVAIPALPISWRISQFFFGSLALVIAGLAARYLTESHRLLFSMGKDERALECLRKIHKNNSPQSEEQLEYWASLDGLNDDLLSSGVQSIGEFKTYVPRAVRPPCYSAIIVLQFQFVFQLCYFTMSYWFGDLNCRQVLWFQIPTTHSECKLGVKSLEDKYSSQNRNELTSSSCSSSSIDPSYEKEVLFVALATLPFLVFMIMRIDQLGRPCFIATSHVIGGFLAFCVHYVIGTEYALFYTSLMEAMWIVSGAASSCLVVELSKTRYRVLGVGLANSLGYLGMAMGTHGLLLMEGAGCIAVISLSGIVLTGV
ncbi:uncharacterized protein LOC124407024 [Diprion similis]|uniref:uncharacterized protein LOC124407024 n=1 Tax=Diprion similis TaxID=362088 RepID=UPI001EF7F896|nr:uncharacterized protein LOC124407024 [Diprion similis]